MTYPEEMHLALFECCQLTKGHGRTLLVDFQRGRFEFLANEMHDILVHDSRERPLREILNAHDTETQAVIQEYVDLLLREEYAFLCPKEDMAFFPKLDLSWDHPASITNCIIDLKGVPANTDDYDTAITDLDALGCENIQIRDFHGLPVDFITAFLSKFDNTILYRIELLLKQAEPLERYRDLLAKHPRINELILHSTSTDCELPTGTTQKAFMTTMQVSSEACCGIVSPKHFNFELTHFLESNNYNSCLNRKVSIDADGNIKNCPSMTQDYGNIRDTRLRDVVHKEEFTRIWNIKKNDVSDCSVCEFRHVCTDCRAYQSEHLSYNKPAKCTYDPYRMVWQ